jgi:hypothetical protein
VCKGHAEWRRRRVDRLKGQNADRKGQGAGHPGTKGADDGVVGVGVRQ